MDSHSIEDASESNFIEALKTGSKSVAALANISRTHNENGTAFLISFLVFFQLFEVIDVHKTSIIL